MHLTKCELYELAVTNEGDLYNTETRYYISGDKENEELIVYQLADGEADELAALSREYNEKCWLAFLGIGGTIYKDPWEWIMSDSCTETGWVECGEYKGE